MKGLIYFAALSILTNEEDILQGNLKYHRSSHLYEGSLAISIEDLNRFESFFHNHRLYGTVTTNLHFIPKEGKQAISCDLSAYRVRYENVLVDDLSIQGSVEDLLSNPKEEIHLLAEKVYKEGIYLEKLELNSQSIPESSWPFSLAVEGRIEAPFETHLTGNWKQEEGQILVELTEATGTLIDIPLHLEHPVSLSWKEHVWELTPHLS